MSWRKFRVLLRGLSPNSATVVKIASSRQFGSKSRVHEVRGTRATQRAFDALFRPATPSG